MPNSRGGNQQVLSHGPVRLCHEHQLRRQRQHAKNSMGTSTLQLPAPAWTLTTSAPTARHSAVQHQQHDLTVMQLLVDLNANTAAGAAVSSGANTVFSGINTAGGIANASLADSGLAYTPGPDPYGLRHQQPRLGRHRPDDRHRRCLRRSGHLPVAGRLRQPVRADRLRPDAIPAVRAGVVVLDGAQSERPERAHCPRPTPAGRVRTTGKSRRHWTSNGPMPSPRGPRSSSSRPTASRFRT